MTTVTYTPVDTVEEYRYEINDAGCIRFRALILLNLCTGEITTSYYTAAHDSTPWADQYIYALSFDGSAELDQVNEFISSHLDEFQTILDGERAAETLEDAARMLGSW